ncbi:P1 family peptidase [Streptomyces sp. SID13031]|uniref:P1 family peptidase n=1 Tax=Streptomyces sp. SID13031 TaxID=2706046 RepID=UPI0013C9EF74|nr:P1 family peptidase [Streptomyces sp. SID13031]NEA33728.1 P1 family peptidase [Streptomyces sp. SID13031]
MRIRSLGVAPGTLPTGRLNAITDVPGVLVGQTTLTGDGVNTGVTAIVPPGFEAGVPGFEAGLPAAIAVGNGYGKLVGSTQVDELGVLETPILLTGTLSVFRVADALLTWLLDRDPSATSLNPVVGETNDGYLSDIRARPITPAHVFAALDTASADLPAEGNVGAGTGTVALGFKAGIGTASRVVGSVDAPAGGRSVDGVVGVLVQANFSGVLTVLGAPIPAPAETPVPEGNSCMIVVATDLPLDARQLGRVARRAVFALGRVGSDFSPGSGDYAIAFSTSRAAPMREYDLKAVFTACIEAVEEALLNSLTMASTVTGYGGNTQYAVPHELITNRARQLPRPAV